MASRPAISRRVQKHAVADDVYVDVSNAFLPLKSWEFHASGKFMRGGICVCVCVRVPDESESESESEFEFASWPPKSIPPKQPNIAIPNSVQEPESRESVETCTSSGRDLDPV